MSPVLGSLRFLRTRYAHANSGDVAPGRRGKWCLPSRKQILEKPGTEHEVTGQESRVRQSMGTPLEVEAWPALGGPWR